MSLNIKELGLLKEIRRKQELQFILLISMQGLFTFVILIYMMYVV